LKFVVGLIEDVLGDVARFSQGFGAFKVTLCGGEAGLRGSDGCSGRLDVCAAGIYLRARL
jgi:hypothetical protein